MERILACVDHSDVTAAVLAQAATLARLSGGRLTLLHVAPADPEWVGWEPGPQSVRDDVAAELREAHRATQALADALRPELDVEALCVQGPAVEEIVAMAQKLEADVVVIGARRRGRLAELFAGSVAKSLFRWIDRPLLVVPAEPASQR